MLVVWALVRHEKRPQQLSWGQGLGGAGWKEPDWGLLTP